MYTAHSVDNDKASGRTFSMLPLKRMISPIIVLVIGVGLSITAMKLVDYKVRTDVQIEFDKSVSSLSTRVQTGFSKQESVLNNLDGLFKASVQVVRDVFELYSTIPAKSEPGILSIAYANEVNGAQLQDLVLYNRSEGNFSYKVYPAGQRSSYEPVSYIVPFEKNSHISGLDLMSNPTFANAINRSKKARGVVSTPMFNYRGGDTMSVVLMTTVEKKHGSATPESELSVSRAGDKFDGIVYVELDIQRFLRGIIGDTVGTDKNIVYDVRTYNEAGVEQVLFHSPEYDRLYAAGGNRLHTERAFLFGDKKFYITVANSPSLLDSYESKLGLITLLGCLVLTLALCGFLISMLSSRERAVKLADRITASNRRILELSRDIIAVMSQDGIWNAVNPAVQQILGYSAQEFEHRHFTQFLHDTRDFDTLLPQLLTTVEETDINVEVQMRTKDGELRWISWCFTVVASDSIVYCNGRDVTDAKAAEEQIKLKSKQLAIAEQLAHEASEFKSTFMIRMTEKVRGSLADSLLNLHKISSNMDFRDESQLQFLKLANQSSDQLYDIVSDLLEVAHGSNTQTENISAHLLSCINVAEKNLIDDSGIGTQLRVHGVRHEHVAGIDAELLTSALQHIMGALREGDAHSTIEYIVDENTVENVLEIQILTSYNPLVEEMIRQYNSSSGNLIDELGRDKGNIMFRLGVAASQFRRMNCNVSFESLGREGNVVLMTVPKAIPILSSQTHKVLEY